MSDAPDYRARIGRLRRPPRRATDPIRPVVQLLHRSEHGAQRSAPTGDVDSARVGKTVNILNVEEREPSTLGGAFGKAVQLLARLGVAVGIGPLQDGDGKKAFEVL